MKKILVVLLIIGVLLTSGCTSDKEYEAPTKVETASSGEENPSETTATTTEPETPKVQEFEIGDTTTDDELKFTVNSVRFTSEIDEQNNEFMIAEAPSGEEYAIIDITVENILSDETQAVSTMFQAEILDQDGYAYDLDFEGQVALKKSFADGEILPGMKRRGEIAFLVPTDATDLKFMYKFDIISGGHYADFRDGDSNLR
jgi:hypothetical protein